MGKEDLPKPSSGRAYCYLQLYSMLTLLCNIPCAGCIEGIAENLSVDTQKYPLYLSEV